ncbi:MAG TPA: VOC family protein [Anaerovoracaceae bacterium]|nr:VOC family protein [Anaerovoracaceae bacterium]
MDTENKNGLFPIALNAVVLDCKDIDALADFYIRLLGWEKSYGDDEWVDVSSTSCGVKISFQRNEDYVPPVWPEEPDAQQQMMHLDFAVHSKEEMGLAEKHALSCGAVKADIQYGGDEWVTLFDPAGHPFCFVIW